MADTNKDSKDKTTENVEPDSILNNVNTKITKFVSPEDEDPENVNPDLDNEAEKEEDTSEEDFENFDVDKVDELKETKKDDPDK